MMSMGDKCYDLHSHTYYSDGMLSPADLILRAIEKGVNVLAITDHDSTNALNEAHDFINTQQLPLKLIDGVEISTNWKGFDIHVVGLNIDRHHVAMTDLLAEQIERRNARALEIGQRLEKKVIANAYAETQKLANGHAITRAHFARFLVAAGVVKNVDSAFKKYLKKGKSAYVPPMWCDIPAAVAAIHAAGGVAVLAHPARYDISGKWLRQLLVDFKAAGGDAIEVVQSQQSPDKTQQLTKHAIEYGFLGSVGSDFHEPSSWRELGKGLHLPSAVTPIWQQWSL